LGHTFISMLLLFSHSITYEQIKNMINGLSVKLKHLKK
jgi:hypothetical protein